MRMCGFIDESGAYALILTYVRGWVALLIDLNCVYLVAYRETSDSIPF